MFRYLKAAFFQRVQVGGLGDVPANILFVLAMVIMGFGHPAFWLLGLGLELAYLLGLSTNGRFQKTVDAQDLDVQSDDTEAKHKQLAAQLLPPAGKQLAELQAKCDRAVELARAQGLEDYLIDGNRSAMTKLAWLYLKLLLARQNLSSPRSQADDSAVRKQVADLDRDVASKKLSDAVLESKRATLQILRKRLDNFQRREGLLQEIESDLTRIEAQIELAVENAGMSGQPQAVSSNISLVSQLLEPDLYGISQLTVAELDRTYDAPTPSPAPANRETA